MRYPPLELAKRGMTAIREFYKSSMIEQHDSNVAGEEENQDMVDSKNNAAGQDLGTDQFGAYDDEENKQSKEVDDEL